MEVNGISRAELAQQLDNLGISENKNQILSIFDEIDKDESLKNFTNLENSENWNVQQNNEKLNGIELDELLKRAKDYLGEKTDQLRKVLIKTGGYAEHRLVPRYDGSGLNKEITTEFDEHSRPTRETYDYDSDGKIDYDIRNEYDAHGRLTRATADKNGNGKIDYELLFEYDERGNKTHEAEDKNGDGKYEYDKIWEYDEHGYIIREAYDKNGDRKWDYDVRYERNEEGRITRVMEDSNGDGVVDYDAFW